MLPHFNTIAPSFPNRIAVRFSDAVWTVFLVWTAIGFVVMPLGLSEAAASHWLAPGLIRQAAVSLLHVSDAIWMLLAAVVVYLHTAASEGIVTARRWVLIILVGAGGVEWLGASTGFPFGPYRYTDQFGWRLGGVLPLAIPLAWMVVVLSGRSLILWLRPASTRLELALGVAVLATLTDVNLEIVAWKVRGYWNWYPDTLGIVPPWPPVQNYISWFAVSFLLVCLLPANHSLRQRPSPRRPVLVLGLMNTLFVLVYAVRWLGFRTTR